VTGFSGFLVGPEWPAYDHCGPECWTVTSMDKWMVSVNRPCPLWLYF